MLWRGISWACGGKQLWQYIWYVDLIGYSTYKAQARACHIEAAADSFLQAVRAPDKQKLRFANMINTYDVWECPVWFHMANYIVVYNLFCFCPVAVHSIVGYSLLLDQHSNCLVIIAHMQSYEPGLLQLMPCHRGFSYPDRTPACPLLLQV